MLLLEILLLFIGLVISLVTLLKQDPAKNVITRRLLSILYIILFLMSVLLIFSNYLDTEESGLKLVNSLNTIKRVISIQSDTLLTIIDKTNDLKRKMDTIVTKTENAIIQRERSQKIFLEQNEILERSNQLTQQQINDSKPNVTTYTPHITFTSIDSNETQCKIVLSNEGKRTASKLKHRIIFLFKDKENDNYFRTNISRIELNEIFPSKMLVIRTYIPFSYKEIISSTNGGSLIILLKYFDDITNAYYDKQFLFDLRIENDKLLVWRESYISSSLKDYFIKNKIDLLLE